MKDSYFYLADMGPDAKSINSVVAYSIASATMPLAYELGYEYHDPFKRNLLDYQVIGLAIPSGQKGKGIKEFLDNTG